MIKPAAEKMLSDAMDCVHYTQVQTENFHNHAPRAVKAWKAEQKKLPSNKMLIGIVKVAVPIIDKLDGKRKQVVKDLDKLFKAGRNPDDYYCGQEFRERNKQLLESSKAFDREAARVVGYLKTLFNGLYPLCDRADVKAMVRSLVEFTKRLNTLKIMINRV